MFDTMHHHSMEEVVPMSVLYKPWNETNGGHPRFNTTARLDMREIYRRDDEEDMRWKLDGCTIEWLDDHDDVILEENPHYFIFTGLDGKGGRSIADQEQIRQYHLRIQQRDQRLKEERQRIPLDCIPEGVNSKERISMLSQMFQEMKFASMRGRGKR